MSIRKTVGFYWLCCCCCHCCWALLVAKIVIPCTLEIVINCIQLFRSWPALAFCANDERVNKFGNPVIKPAERNQTKITDFNCSYLFGVDAESKWKNRPSDYLIWEFNVFFCSQSTPFHSGFIIIRFSGHRLAHETTAAKKNNNAFKIKLDFECIW